MSQVLPKKSIDRKAILAAKRARTANDKALDLVVEPKAKAAPARGKQGRKKNTPKPSHGPKKKDCVKEPKGQVYLCFLFMVCFSLASFDAVKYL